MSSIGVIPVKQHWQTTHLASLAVSVWNKWRWSYPRGVCAVNGSLNRYVCRKGQVSDRALQLAHIRWMFMRAFILLLSYPSSHRRGLLCLNLTTSTPRSLKGIPPMSKRKAYFIPPPYYHPAMYALKLFRQGGYDLGDAIRISYRSFTDPKAKDRISPTVFNQKQLKTYIFHWLRRNAEWRSEPPPRQGGFTL